MFEVKPEPTPSVLCEAGRTVFLPVEGRVWPCVRRRTHKVTLTSAVRPVELCEDHAAFAERWMTGKQPSE